MTTNFEWYWNWMQINVNHNKVWVERIKYLAAEEGYYLIEE